MCNRWQIKYVLNLILFGTVYYVYDLIKCEPTFLILNVSDENHDSCNSSGEGLVRAIFWNYIFNDNIYIHS